MFPINLKTLICTHTFLHTYRPGVLQDGGFISRIVGGENFELVSSIGKGIRCVISVSSDATVPGIFLIVQEAFELRVFARSPLKVRSRLVGSRGRHGDRETSRRSGI